MVNLVREIGTQKYLTLHTHYGFPLYIYKVQGFQKPGLYQGKRGPIVYSVARICYPIAIIIGLSQPSYNQHYVNYVLSH